jgi:hypothetical protein
VSKNKSNIKKERGYITDVILNPKETLSMIHSVKFQTFYALLVQKYVIDTV